MIMKQKILAVSVAAALTGGIGISGSANAALSVVFDGIGHDLLVPYFSTQNGNATLLNIVNTDTVNGKAVKVRFRSGVDSDDVMDFQVFLSPNDMWTANISADATTGISKLTTTDRSCTLPPNVNQSFVTTRLASYTDPAGSVHSIAEQTREGYVEIFNMANIPKFLPSGVGTALDATRTNPLWTAIKHVGTPGTPPCTSNTLLGIEAIGGVVTVPAVAGATTTMGGPNYATNQQVTMPTGTLMGNWTLVNVPKTLAFSDGMPTIRSTGAQTMIVYSGQTGTARVASHLAADNGSGNMFPTLRLTEDGVLLNQAQNGVITADYDFPDMSSPYEANPGVDNTPFVQAATLSGAYASSTVLNEFVTDATIGAGSDWVLSMPTRRYHVAGRGTNYGASGDTKGYPATEAIEGIPGGPTQFIGGQYSLTNVTYALDGRSSCVATGNSPTYFDREETASVGGGSVISPGVPTTYSLCGETNVLSWNNSGTTSSTLFSTLVMYNSSAGSVSSGWAKMNMGSGATGTLALPVMGNLYGKAVNAGVTPSVYFGGTYKHRYVN